VKNIPKKKVFIKIIIFILILLPLLIYMFFISHAIAAEKIRRPSSAGVLYPQEPTVLKETLQKMYGELQPVPATSDKLVACVVPHSGWGLCGNLIARSFNELKEGEFNNIIILAPSHRFNIHGCSMPSVQGFATPLGVVRVNYEIMEKLALSPYIIMQSLQKTARPGKLAIHEQEYSIEVLLPMLQYKMKKLEIVPVIVGDFVDTYGKESQIVFKDIVETFRRAMTEKTLVILSTDLTSWGTSFNFTPAPNEQMLEEQEKLDRELIELLLNKDFYGLQDYFERTKNPVCGKYAMYLFLTLLPKNAKGVLLGYEQSGRKMNLKDTSIGFSAINYYVPSVGGTPQ